MDLVLHIEESFIHRFLIATKIIKKRESDAVKCNRGDSNQLFKKQDNQTSADQTESWLQKIKKFILDPKSEDDLNDDKQPLVSNIYIPLAILHVHTNSRNEGENRKIMHPYLPSDHC